MPALFSGRVTNKKTAGFLDHHRLDNRANTMERTKPDLVVASTPKPKVRVLAFNRPEKRNALSQDLIRQFLDELRQASTDPDIRAIVITGNETAFSGKYPGLLKEYTLF